MKWKTEKRKVADLIPSTYNPRKISDKERTDLLASIEEFNQVVPVVVNTDEHIIGGHQRCELYADLGIEEIEVRIPERKLTKTEEKRLNLRLNKNTGSWDSEKLAKFDIGQLLDVGFGEDELGEFWDDVDIMEDDHKLEKAVEEAKETNVKAGDMYQLGDHKLLCGDSTDPEAVKKLVDIPIDMVYCDPPYNIGLDYSSGLTTARKYKGDKSPGLKYRGTELNDSKKIGDFTEFLNKTIQNAKEVAKEDTHVFYWCDERFIFINQQLFEQNGIANKRVCLWIKNNFNMTPQTAFNKVYEPCVYGIVGKPKLNPKFKNLNEILNKEIESGNQVHDEIAELFNIWIAKRDNTQDYEHPTQKPLNLHEKPLKRTTKVGSGVLDLFGGSGSTLLACEQLKRKARLMEIDPIFCQVIINRWEEYSGGKAKKI